MNIQETTLDAGVFRSKAPPSFVVHCDTNTQRFSATTIQLLCVNSCLVIAEKQITFQTICLPENLTSLSRHFDLYYANRKLQLLNCNIALGK